MELTSSKSRLSGAVRIPGSKSHTIRSVAIASLARGLSVLRRPLRSADSRAAVQACRALGAEIDDAEEDWTVRGTAGKPRGGGRIDVLNSGTTLYVAMTAAALADGATEFTGDAQIQSRPADKLMQALDALGAKCRSLKGNGCAPLRVEGVLRGGAATIECPTSQYLTSLLLGCPLAAEDTEITIPLLHERPYVEMTLSWLRKQNIELERRDMNWFRIKGGQSYTAFEETIPADFSSATFFLAAACVTGSTLTLEGLDIRDTQGDKAVLGYFEEMGARVRHEDGAITISSGGLRGRELDLNATPDALPAMAAAACFAEGETRLVNVPQARLKETDRIAVMAEELQRLGGQVREMEDGLIIQGGGLRGGRARGRGDHRVVMALATAGLAASSPVRVDTAEAVEVTFPDFIEQMRQTGAQMTLIQ